MTAPVTIHADSGHIAAAARALGISPDLPLGEQGREVIRHIAADAGADRTRNAIAGAGHAPKRAGRTFELSVVDHAQRNGFPEWDRGPLRGRRDLLDLVGTLPDGWLIGTKSTERGVDAGTKLRTGMAQCHDAMGNLAAKVEADTSDVIPVQVIHRPGHPIGAAYAVTEYDWLLALARERRGWRRKAGTP